MKDRRLLPVAGSVLLLALVIAPRGAWSAEKSFEPYLDDVKKAGYLEQFTSPLHPVAP